LSQAKEFWTISAKGDRVAACSGGDCGMPLFAKNEMYAEFLALKPGSLDHSSPFRPMRILDQISPTVALSRRGDPVLRA
jgi:hypothetical protein